MKFTWDSGQLSRRLKQLPPEVDRAVRVVAGFQATRAEAHMKTTAPWTDRTGAARSGLFTLTRFTPHQYLIILAHSMHYGIWLEVANSGDYQVILPSVRKIGEDMMRQLDGLFGRLPR